MYVPLMTIFVLVVIVCLCIAATTTHCPECRSRIPRGGRICPRCRADLTKPTAAAEEVGTAVQIGVAIAMVAGTLAVFWAIIALGL